MPCDYCKKELDANNTTGFCSGDCFIAHNIQVSIRFDIKQRTTLLEQAGKIID